MPNPWSRCTVVVAVALGPLALAACPRRVPLDGPVCESDFRETPKRLQLPINRDVDILFVIDNSGSMAEEQVKLNAGIAPLFERLDAAEANYRIAFTTSDNGNPWCPPGTTTPEGGKLVLSPCFERLDNFLFLDQVDARDFACNDQCSLDAAALAIAPTSTDADAEAKPRAWLERIAERSNLPDATAMLDAFRCFAPQGVNGCGFESQLESMQLALARAENPSEPNFGFLRPDALLAVVVLTDEADCSYNKDWSDIFDPDAGKTFWSDPSAAYPSSAMCWNAGVTCTGDPSGYSSCEPADKAIDGSDAIDDAAAVLWPVARYADALSAIEAEKQQYQADNELVFTLIAGVEGGGEDWSVSYADSPDPNYQLLYGIGPGCTSADGGPAVPPVRARALAEGVDPLGLHSVCAADYSEAMAALGERITGQFQPLCYAGCVADGDLATAQLEADCVLLQDLPGNADSERVPECVREADGAYAIDGETGRHRLPDDADVCYAALVDPDGSVTADPNDDISAACHANHYNVEFVIVRRPGAPAPGGTSISVQCEESPCPDDDCPDLGNGD